MNTERIPTEAEIADMRIIARDGVIAAALQPYQPPVVPCPCFLLADTPEQVQRRELSLRRRQPHLLRELDDAVMRRAQRRVRPEGDAA